MKYIFALSIAIASLSGEANVQAHSLRGNGFEDQAFTAITLTGHHKQDCVNDCEQWWGASKETCQSCCEEGKDRTGKWSCDAEEDIGGYCASRCSRDSDCQQGGLVICGTCNKMSGTNHYKQCIADSKAPETTPSPRGSSICTNAPDDSCWTGGWPACCDKGPGACPSQGEPRPPCNVWQYPGGSGGQCARHCSRDSDCYHGGFVMCGTCNKLHGTQGYNTCINPPDNEEDMFSI